MDATATQLLKPMGDIELWYAEADDKSWRLPLHIEWKASPDGKQFALVRQALCFYQTQLMMMHGLLHAHSIEKSMNQWLVPAGVVNAVLFKAPGISAEFYYSWPEDGCPPIPSPHYPHLLRGPDVPDPVRQERHRSFAEYVAKERHIPVDVVLVVLTAIGQLGAKWLMNRNVIDLGFAKLVALPFRGNWKEIVAFKGKPWKILRVLKQPKPVRNSILAENGFEQMAASVHNIGLKRGGHRLEYVIEAIPTQQFETIAGEIEGERMKTGKLSYITQYERAVEQLYEHIVDAMAHYARKVAAAWACVRDGRSTGVLALLPINKWNYKVRNVHLSDLPTHIVPPDSNYSVLEEGEGDPVLIQAQALEVPKVSDIPSEVENVRECSIDRDMGQSRDCGTDGVSLHDAS